MPLSLFHLHGDLKDLRFPRLLAALREDDFTGVFQATVRREGSDNEITREVHFQEGSIAWAISTDPEESLRAYLLRNGAITEAQWAQAEERARENTLREAMVELGLLAGNELTQIERGRAEEIVLALFPASRGEYRVRERQLAPGTPHLRIDPRALILRGVLEGGDRALILEEIGSLDTVYVVKRPVLEEPGLNLPGEYQSVLRLIDGKRSIAQVCALTAMPDYFVCSVFAALSMVGAVRGSHARSQTPRRPAIVKGADVAPAAALDARESAPTQTPPASSREEAAVPALDAIPADEPGIPDEEPAALEEVPGEPASVEVPAAAVYAPPPQPPPPITTVPFAGEGPVTRLEEADPPRRKAPTPPARPYFPAPQRRPTGEDWRPEALDDEAGQEGSRPWFLLGGAAAVGAAALFLILMAQGSGDAVEVPQMPADPTLAREGPSSGEAEKADEPAETYSPGPSPQAAAPAVQPAPEPEREEPLPSQDLAPEPPSRMLEKAGDEELGRESLLEGDYQSAARHFGREVAKGPGGYSIQLLMACQDDTVRRAVHNGGASSELFILSTVYQGRSCYRIYWGRYPTQRRAQEALNREVPAAFHGDRPRVTRLAGS